MVRGFSVKKRWGEQQGSGAPHRDSRFQGGGPRLWSEAWRVPARPQPQAPRPNGLVSGGTDSSETLSLSWEWSESQND